MTNNQLKEMKEKCIEFIKEYFKPFKDKTAVIGVSGGIDSSVCAALCVEALGADRVIALSMPQHKQDDIADVNTLVQHLQLKNFYTIDIGPVVDAETRAINYSNLEDTDADSFYVYRTNTPARIRMTTLYGAAAIKNGLVINTCNRSEDFVGYNTKFGDSAGDLAPIAHLTKKEIRALANYIGLPESLVNKAPQDGLSGKTDEDNFGFTYDELDDYLLYGNVPNEETFEKIKTLHRNNLHKLKPLPTVDDFYMETYIKE